MIYIMSDLHGQHEAFKMMLKKINFKSQRDKLILLGDYIDNLNDTSSSCRLVLDLSDLKEKGCLMAIKGNHDDMMLSTLILRYTKNGLIPKDLIPKTHRELYELESKQDNWYMNRGAYTLNEFEQLQMTNQFKIVKFLHELRPIHIEQFNAHNYYFAHADAMIDSYSGRVDTPEALQMALWGNTQNKNIELLKDDWMTKYPNTILVTGHRITSYYNNWKRYQSNSDSDKAQILKVPHKRRILVDCGAKAIYNKDTLRLGCLRLDDLHEFYIDRQELYRRNT